MKRLVRQKENFRVVTIDIGAFRSPIAAQYGIKRIPTLWLYEGMELRADDKTAEEIYKFLRRG